MDGCRLSGSIKEGPTAEAAARCLVRSRLVATEPQWPRMNSTVSRSLRTRHSRVIPKISLRALRLLRFRPSSLPLRLRCRCWATSSDLHCKSLIRIGRRTVLVPSVRRNVVESWQVQNYSKWNNYGRRGRLSAKFHFLAFGLDLRRRTGSRSGSLPPSCANRSGISSAANSDSGGFPRCVSTSALWCTMPITSILAGTIR